MWILYCESISFFKQLTDRDFPQCTFISSSTPHCQFFSLSSLHHESSDGKVFLYFGVKKINFIFPLQQIAIQCEKFFDAKRRTQIDRVLRGSWELNFFCESPFKCVEGTVFYKICFTCEMNLGKIYASLSGHGHREKGELYFYGFFLHFV